LLATAALLLLLLPATARGDFLGANLNTLGAVNLGYAAPAGTQVYFRERVGDRLKTLGVARSTARTPPSAILLEAVKWRCDRTVRRFQATAIAPNGARSEDSYDVRTPSCENRFELSAPRRVALGARVRVRVKDGWKNGGTKPRLCFTAPRGRRACRGLAFPRAVDIASRQFRATKRGLWRVELRFDGHRERAAIAVGGARPVSAAPLPRVLTTGDSTVWGIDAYLGDRLAETATVRSDVHPGTGVSKDLEWLTRAAGQAKRYRPRTTIISLGALEGHPMRTPEGATRECCDALWAAEYSRRARLMMKSYLRKGRGHVLWLASPAPRTPQLAVVTSIVNAAISHAAEGLAGVRILRLDLLLTPNGYQESLRYRGQTVRVRQTDGVHLTVAGTAIAAEAIEKALRAPPGWISGGS